MTTTNMALCTKICRSLLLYILLYYAIFAFTSKPMEGDSLAYHIPNAKYILDGTMLNPAKIFPTHDRVTNPGSSEGILSLFLLLHIPLNLYNVVGVFVLFIFLVQLGLRFGMEKNYAILFATTFSALHGVVRWLSAQTIDIWLACWFTATLFLLNKPQKKVSYFLALGCTSGMLIGSKFTGPGFFFILLLFYIKPLIRCLNLPRFLAFIIPFSLFGLSWYIRNYLVFGDPYFPLSLPFFKGTNFTMLDEAVWKTMLFYPTGFVRTLNALFSEATIWLFSLPLTILFLILRFKNLREEKYKKIIPLILIGIFCFAVYLLCPSGHLDNLMVTGFRYAYPAFIPLTLAMFLLADIFKKKGLLVTIAVINMMILPELSYHPKILFVLIPVGLLLWYNPPLPIQFFHQKKQ